MKITTKKLFTILSLLTLIPSCVWADFSRSQADLHPTFPADGPFIIEIVGTWPGDCHPGEQKPVVEFYDGHRVEIRFEIITLHVTCNITDTPYRVLVDMSEAVRNQQALGNSLDVRVSFDGYNLETTLGLVCPQEQDCESLAGDQPQPYPGLYNATSLASQGLLVARQNASMAIFPLVYDDSGRSEWLFTGNNMTENTFFTELLRWSEGDCFGCEHTGATPKMKVIGHLSVLVDSPGVLQVKVNDGLFTVYESLVYGYRTFQVGATGERTIIDLEGRWGISENRGTNPPLGDLSEFFPGAFDITLEDIVTLDDNLQFDGQVSYLVTSLAGETLGQLVCQGQTGLARDNNICEFIDPTDASEPLFLFYQDGPSTLSIEFGRPVIAVGVAPGGKAVRLD